MTLTPLEYRLIVEHSPVMIWRSGVDAKCDYFNDTWLAFTGRALEQEMGDGWAGGVHPDDLARCVKHYLDHFDARQPFEMEYRLRRHDGVYRWIFDRGVPFTNEQGAFAGFIGSCIDVEDRRRAQEERERNDREQLALARQFEEWILAIVSHDIRSPLGAIDGSAKLLAMRAGDDEQLRIISGRIARSAARITSIVGDLLDLSRARQGGGMPLALSETDLHALCREVADEIAAICADRKIEIACDGDARGYWDPRRLTQAVSNLIGNAVKHGVPGKSVDIRLRSEKDRAIVEVHNEGAIPSHILPTLFQPFARRDDSTGHKDGLGLGLFIAKSIAHAHRGDLQVDSTPERGTTFRLLLPASR